MLRWIVYTLAVAMLVLATPSLASDSCCMKAAAVAAGDVPIEWEPDGDVKQPEDWDEEEDGLWERPMKPKAPPGRLVVFRKELVISLLGACPWLLLGLLFTGLMQAFAPSQKTVERFLSGDGFLAVGKGAALGLSSPLCSCGVLPLVLSLSNAGASPRALVAFLVAAQSAGIDSFAFTYGALGPNIAVARMAIAGLMGVVVGSATPSLASSRSSAERKAPGFGIEEKQGMTIPRRMLTGLREATTENFEEVAPAVAGGFALASAVVAFLPAGGLSAAASVGGILGRGAVLLLALPLQFCEHAAVPLAAALQRTGVSGGLAFSVLATLPGMNAASFGVVANLAGASGAARVVVAMWSCGLVGSYFADWAGAEVIPVSDNTELLPYWYQHASRWIIGAMLLGTVWRAVARRFQTPSADAASGCCSHKSCKKE